MNIVGILKGHAAWMDGKGGARADLRGADLRGANLTWAYLSGANLSRANLTMADLRWADLTGADLRGANLSVAYLSGANLSRADLRGADLRGANLTRTDLRGAYLSRANLTGANLDMSSGIPFHCGGAAFKGDDRLAAQMIYHFARGDWSGCSGGVQEAVDAIRSMAITDLFCEYRSDIT